MYSSDWSALSPVTSTLVRILSSLIVFIIQQQIFEETFCQCLEPRAFRFKKKLFKNIKQWSSSNPGHYAVKVALEKWMFLNTSYSCSLTVFSGDCEPSFLSGSPSPTKGDDEERVGRSLTVSGIFHFPRATVLAWYGMVQIHS